MDEAALIEKLFAMPGVPQVFVSHHLELDEFPAARVPGNPGAHTKGVRRLEYFRVMLWSEASGAGKRSYAESKQPTLVEAIAEAFHLLGEKPPAWLPPLPHRPKLADAIAA